MLPSYEAKSAIGVTTTVTKSYTTRRCLAFINMLAENLPLTKSGKVDIATARELFQTGWWRLKVITAVAKGQEDAILDKTVRHAPKISEPQDSRIVDLFSTVVVRSIQLTDVHGDTILTFDDVPSDDLRFVRSISE